MANSKSVFIIRDEDINKENYEEMLSTWFDENQSGKTAIAGESTGVFLVNEEDDAIMCLEYFD